MSNVSKELEKRIFWKKLRNHACARCKIIYTCKNILTYWFQSTCCERISNVSLQTDTVCNMIDYLTLSIDSASSTWTWVRTMEVLTCFSRGTFSICSTFWSAGNIWVSKVIRYTLTCSCSSSILANSISSTW